MLLLSFFGVQAGLAATSRHRPVLRGFQVCDGCVGRGRGAGRADMVPYMVCVCATLDMMLDRSGRLVTATTNYQAITGQHCNADNRAPQAYRHEATVVQPEPRQ